MASGDEDTDNKGNMWIVNPMFEHPVNVVSKKNTNTRENKFYFLQNISALLLLRLAFKSLGVVYGDLGTSPLYVFYNTFPDGIDDTEEVIEALSMIIYSLALIPLIKYVLIVCRANDNGQGGTFALYSLLCRHAKVRTIPNVDQSDEELTTYSCSTVNEQSFAGKTKKWLEKYSWRKTLLLGLVLVGSSMVIGDGILTPAISVLSAVAGIRLDYPNMDKSRLNDEVVIIVAVAILMVLFSVQHHGIDKVGWLFAPIVFLWFLVLGGIGIFNIWKYDSSILKAFSPVYVYRFFRKGKIWKSLGGIMLCVTGTEALFADLSQFPVIAIQIAFTVVVFPCLLLAYSGQAAYLMKNSQDVRSVFYQSIPDFIYWPVFVIATAAACVASQATISATFSVIKQALAFGCFPRVKVVHTSKKYPNHIYIPEINWILMILCVAVTAGFKNQHQIGNATGLAVLTVMLVTTLLMILIMPLVWHCHWILVLIFACMSLLVEGTYFSAMIFKVNRGGWVPLVIAAAFFITMSVWHYGTIKLYQFEMQSKVSIQWILGLGPSLGLVRVPGIGLVYGELPSGVPYIFAHFITNLPAIHSVVVFVCVKYVPVHTVPEGERFLVSRVGPKCFHMFNCVARYGYKDLHRRDDEFETNLFDNLFRFARLESLMESCSDSEVYSIPEQQATEHSAHNTNLPGCNKVTTHSTQDSTLCIDSHELSFNPMVIDDEMDELEFLTRCRDTGVVHILGKTVVMARRDSEFHKKIVIDYIYAFLRKVCRENSVIFNVPHECLLNVGQVILV
ncbi:Potassium transporter [Melia azedarach]|uniref:Potassium transporter n=1 Tax=Melia azedarach TaxID=155640 RepID=A0ACC1WUK0_MELAZ|nr:Potassium transporter [Melia azedarach]